MIFDIYAWDIVDEVRVTGRHINDALLQIQLFSPEKSGKIYYNLLFVSKFVYNYI